MMAHRLPAVGDKVVGKRGYDLDYEGVSGVVFATDEPRASEHKCSVEWADGGQTYELSSRLTITGARPLLEAAKVRGSKDRLRLEWGGPNGDTATGPDGRFYMLQSELVRGEGRAWWFFTGKLPFEERELVAQSCPYGYVATKAEARRTAEWLAWHRAGRP